MDKGFWGYRSYKEHLEEKFPNKSYRKLCLDAGFTCPNIDGTKSTGGCTYCNNAGFAPSKPKNDLLNQWDRGRDYLRARYRKVDGFIAYLQSYSNTYSELERLKSIYEEVLSFPECVGLSISTRPDCLSDEIIEYLDELGKKSFVTLEIGCESDKDEILKEINRGHDYKCFLDAIEKASNKSFELCAHFILGFQGEGEDAPERIGKLVATLPIQSVKIHNLHIMRGTKLAEQYLQGGLDGTTSEKWLDIARRFVSQIRPNQSVQRIVADAPDRILMSQNWCQDKQKFLRLLKRV